MTANPVPREPLPPIVVVSKSHGDRSSASVSAATTLFGPFTSFQEATEWSAQYEATNHSRELTAVHLFPSGQPVPAEADPLWRSDPSAREAIQQALDAFLRACESIVYRAGWDAALSAQAGEVEELKAALSEIDRWIGYQGEHSAVPTKIQEQIREALRAEHGAEGK